MCIFCNWHTKSPCFVFDLLELNGNIEKEGIDVCVECSEHLEPRPNTHILLETTKKDEYGCSIYFSFPKNKIQEFILNHKDYVKYN